MSDVEKNWRDEESSLKEVIDKYPHISPFIILKTDVQRRGIAFTEAAKGKLDKNKDAVAISNIFTEQEEVLPVGITLRDATSIVYFATGEKRTYREPYVVDVVDDKIVLTDDGKVIDEVEYWPKADYFDKTTSSGTPMWKVFSARPQRLDIAPNRHCHFWDKPGNGCKYCPIGALSKDLKDSEKNVTVNVNDVYETVKEALKKKGRFSQFVLTAGSILSGKELLDDEVDLYIKVLKEIGKNFKADKFPSQLIGTAYNERQLKRLHEETGLMSYTSDIEVLNEEIFNEVCPGKAEFIGYKEWKNRLFKAVGIFGKGRVNTGIVAGVELSKPFGFKSEEEALEAILKEAEDFAIHGVSVAATVWNPAPGTILHNQKNPSLDYYIQLIDGLEIIRRKYDLSVDFDDYRRCGNHPNTDLARI